MLAYTPKRTKQLLRLRRALFAQIREQKPSWPVEAVEAKVTEHMRDVMRNQWPMRKLREVVSSL
jgi:hypothetical protein